MTTIKQAVEATKCRKGAAYATTKSGAFWLAIPEVKIRSWGGDGIGNNAANLDAYLQLRHYRNGTVRAMVHITSWHQNHSSSDRYHHVAIEECATVEDVIVTLKAGVSGDYDRETIYVDRYEDNLTEALVALGLPVSAPAPDDMDATPEPITKCRMCDRPLSADEVAADKVTCAECDKIPL